MTPLPSCPPSSPLVVSFLVIVLCDSSHIWPFSFFPAASICSTGTLSKGQVKCQQNKQLLTSSATPSAHPSPSHTHTWGSRRCASNLGHLFAPFHFPICSSLSVSGLQLLPLQHPCPPSLMAPPSAPPCLSIIHIPSNTSACPKPSLTMSLHW